MVGFLWARICSQKVVRIWADQVGQSFLWRSSREAGWEHLCSQQRVHPFAREAEAEEGGRGVHLFTTLFSPREGAEAASAGEPEERAALCGRLHPPEPRLHLLDPVSLRCSTVGTGFPLAPGHYQAGPPSLKTAKVQEPFSPAQTLQQGLLWAQPVSPPGPAVGPVSAEGLCAGSSLSPRERQ